MSDVAVLGSGPAGCTAAIYLGRAGFSTEVFEGIQAGGQLTITTEVDNFPGFPEGIPGPELMQSMRKQAERFGAKFITLEVEEVDFDGEAPRFKVSDEWREVRAIVIATGASARWLGVEGEKALRGRGVSACATCDGAFFNGREIAIVGGGDSAITEARFLTRFASKVILIHRRQGFRAAKVNMDMARENPKIEFMLDSVIEEILGKERVRGARVRNVNTGEIREIALEGVFIAIGHVPNTAFLRGKIELDEEGFVIPVEGTRTSRPGVFVAGDVADKIYRQAITAAGMGCKAALDVEKYLAAKGVY